MSKALRACRRDIVFSLSNAAPFDHAADWAKWANCWRTTGDIWRQLGRQRADWHYGISEIASRRTAGRRSPGRATGTIRTCSSSATSAGAAALHMTSLTPDEQYTHISLWCLLSAPLLIGCDMERLDPFTLNLLTNDEVLAVDQDALGKQAVRVATIGAVDVYLKELEDGSRAVGFFNRGPQVETVDFDKLRRPRHARRAAGPRLVASEGPRQCGRRDPGDDQLRMERS